jgi:hypothetical protein
LVAKSIDALGVKELTFCTGWQRAQPGFEVVLRLRFG